MQLSSLLLAGVIGTMGFVAGRMARSPPERHETPAGCSQLVLPRAAPVPAVVVPDDDASDSDGEDVADVLAAAGQRMAGEQRTHNAILGRITDQGTGEPLAGVTVIARLPSLALQQAVITDEHGNYELTGLAAGNYTLSFYYSDSKTEYDSVAVSELSPTSLDVAIESD